jgi:hypothetical protein
MQLVNSKVLDQRATYAQAFASARPFRHVVIDQFFDPPVADALLQEFPPFDAKFARNEAGDIGNKAVVEKIRTIGPAYATLDDLIQSRTFLDLIGNITGIDDLQYDPWYFGGGTHENREGQDLDPHIDFNRHPVNGTHRRLNLIVYLNPQWENAWGGALEIHKDPRAADNEVQLINPAFNRCVIFETNEYSWHGFSKIALPPDRKQLSRRSIALYFYTQERPQEERADTHSTIYVDRQIPDHIRPGYTLSEHDYRELSTLIARRDQHNQRLYRDITQLTTQLEQANSTLSSGRLGRLAYFARRVLQRIRRDIAGRS